MFVQQDYEYPNEGRESNMNASFPNAFTISSTIYYQLNVPSFFQVVHNLEVTNFRLECCSLKVMLWYRWYDPLYPALSQLFKSLQPLKHFLCSARNATLNPLLYNKLRSFVAIIGGY